MGIRRCVAVALGLALLAGCGPAGPAQQPGGSVSPSFGTGDGSPTSTPGGDPVTPNPAGSGGQPPASGEIRLRGTIEAGVEAGCLVLRTSDGKTYELSGGDPSLRTAGARVEVRGKIRTDLASLCMQGPIVQVIEIKPA